MSESRATPLLLEHVSLRADPAGLAQRMLIVAVGVVLLTAAAKVRVPMWPVPVTMQTFAVLTLGTVMGSRLGLATVLAYLAVGALGVDVFTSSGGGARGLAYMAGPTGGYLAGFAVAAWLMGRLAERGWDRTVWHMALAMLAGNGVIYALGLPWMAWLFLAERGWQWVLHWGLVAFLPGDALKLALAILVMPMARRTLRQRP